MDDIPPGDTGGGRRRQPQGAFSTHRAPPDGPCFLLVRREDGESWGSPNPFRVARQLDAVLGQGGTLQAKIIRSGALLVQVLSGFHAARLMACTSFLGRVVEVVLADRLNCTEGVIVCDALSDMTDNELLSELEPQGVVGVCRLAPRDPNKTNPTIRLSFNGPDLHITIRCVYLIVNVSPWVAARPRCNRCWTWGHRGRTCRSRHPRCGKCGEQSHSTRDCRAVYLSCPACGGPHPAWDKGCPEVREERRAHRQAQKEAAEEHRRGRRFSTSATSWPTPSEAHETAPTRPRGPPAQRNTPAPPQPPPELPETSPPSSSTTSPSSGAASSRRSLSQPPRSTPHPREEPDSEGSPPRRSRSRSRTTRRRAGTPHRKR